MSNSNYIFQAFEPNSNVSAHFLARCLTAATIDGFTERFIRLNGGYTAHRFFYSNQDVTHLQVYAIDDHTTGQSIKFTRLLCGDIKGYVIDYQPINQQSSNK